MTLLAVLDLIDCLEEVRDAVTPERAHAEFDETTLQVFWKKWPGISPWAGSTVEDAIRGAGRTSEPDRDPDLDEVGGSG